MKTALIISGGEFSLPEPLPEYEYAIACDKGAEYAKACGISPNAVLGDFDSYTGNIEEAFPDAEILKYPAMKDDTDTMLAVKLALSKCFDHLILLCALGNRMDHTISNLQSLHYIAIHGAIGELYSSREHFRTLSAIEGSLTLSKRENYSLSLFSLSDTCAGLSISGAKYNAENISLTNSFPLGHGNDFVNPEVTISLKKGILLIVESLI